MEKMSFEYEETADRKDSSAAQTVPAEPSKEFVAKYEQLTTWENRSRWIAVASSVLFFPFGLVSLAAVLRRVRAPLVLGLHFGLFELAVAGVAALTVFGVYDPCWLNFDECPEPWYFWALIPVLIPALITSGLGIFCGFKLRRLELELLGENPSGLLVLRKDSLALANELDEFELEYRKFLVLEDHCRGFCVALCLFFFPLGFLLLFGLLPSFKPKLLRTIAQFVLLLNIACIVTVVVVKMYPFLIMDGTSFFLLGGLFYFLEKTLAMEARLEVRFPGRLEQCRLSPRTQPNISFYDF